VRSARWGTERWRVGVPLSAQKGRLGRGGLGEPAALNLLHALHNVAPPGNWGQPTAGPLPDGRDAVEVAVAAAVGGEEYVAPVRGKEGVSVGALRQPGGVVHAERLAFDASLRAPEDAEGGFRVRHVRQPGFVAGPEVAVGSGLHCVLWP